MDNNCNTISSMVTRNGNILYYGGIHTRTARNSGNSCDSPSYPGKKSGRLDNIKYHIRQKSNWN